MKQNDFASLFPKDKKSHCKPITINYRQGNEKKVVNFFRRVVTEALTENPPRVFKQIAFFYINGELKYLKPFEL